MEIVALPILTALLIVLLSTPSFIKVAEIKHLFDEPDEDRKKHARKVPLMGGMMIFAGTMFSFLLWLPSNELGIVKFLVPSLLIMFFVGMKDDIIGTAPVKKLAAHLIVAFIMVLMADLRLTSLHGLFGIREIPEWASIMLSVFTYIVVVNAFNLIDGVDGLAAGVALIVSLTFGTWFYIAEDYVFAVLALSLAGALIGFLRFNFNPAKIFMGDSGSLTIGFIIAVMSIHLIEFKSVNLHPIIDNISKPIFTMSVLVYPLVDTMRVFIIRIIDGKSPFSADRNHIHHRLIDLGLGHKLTTIIIYMFNLLVISSAVYAQHYNPSYAFFVIIIAVAVVIHIPFFIKTKNID